MYICCRLNLISGQNDFNLGHTCNKPGCESVLVLDGNMKNARQVCSCRVVGELKFAGMDGSVVIGK